MGWADDQKNNATVPSDRTPHGPSAASTTRILSGEEVAQLDLRGVELVVLSACRTGLGEISVGEGVLGLRRAFDIAGAQTLVLSLWDVDDSSTALLTDQFYRQLLRRRRDPPPAVALRNAQLELLHHNREAGDPRPQDWAAFITVR